MAAGTLAGIIGAVMLLIAGLSQADNVGRIEPLDATPRITGPAGEPGVRSERRPLLRDSQTADRPLPQGNLSPQTATPFGAPMPPNHLTPAPVLPFNPNGSLMPPSSPPHPPHPAR